MVLKHCLLCLGKITGVIDFMCRTDMKTFRLPGFHFKPELWSKKPLERNAVVLHLM